MKKFLSLALCVLLAVSLLGGCGQSGESGSSSVVSGSKSSESSSIDSNALIGPNIDKAPADLSDLDAVTKIYSY